jgi:hypothetical protein
MILEKDLNKVLNRLYYDEAIQIHSGGSNISVRLLDRNSKISLRASVYEGDNYIPMSVRKCVGGKTPFSGGWIHTDVTIDEANFQVFLSYVGGAQRLNPQNIKDLLEEFSWQADEWRLYLEEHDKHDLMHVFVK